MYLCVYRASYCRDAPFDSCTALGVMCCFALLFDLAFFFCYLSLTCNSYHMPTRVQLGAVCNISVLFEWACDDLLVACYECVQAT